MFVNPHSSCYIGFVLQQSALGLGSREKRAIGGGRGIDYGELVDSKIQIRPSPRIGRVQTFLTGAGCVNRAFSDFGVGGFNLILLPWCLTKLIFFVTHRRTNATWSERSDEDSSASTWLSSCLEILAKSDLCSGDNNPRCTVCSALSMKIASSFVPSMASIAEAANKNNPNSASRDMTGAL